MADSNSNPNIFILSVDSLRQDRFSDAMTEIGDLLDGVVFPNAVSTASQTSSAMPGLAASLYHDSLPVWGFPEQSHATLAEILKDAGYTTGLWTDNYLFGAHQNYDRGFDHGNLGKPTAKKRLAINIKKYELTKRAFKAGEWAYFNIFKQLRDMLPGSESFYRPAGYLNGRAMDWMDRNRPDRMFCWIHYMDTHHPFEAPEKYLAEVDFNTDRSRSELAEFTRHACKSNGQGVTEWDLEDLNLAYNACCDYLRDEMTRFIRELRDKGHLDPAEDIVVFTSDHGQCLAPERGLLGHIPPSFWEEIMNVPLAISRPDWNPAVIDGQVSLIDVMPTVLDAIGVDSPAKIDGVPRSTPEEMVRQYAIFVSQWRSRVDDTMTIYRGVRADCGWKLYGRQIEDRDEVVLTQYEKLDPDSEEVVYASSDASRPEDSNHRERWDELDEVLHQRGRPIEIAGEGVRTSPETEEHLKNLGYID